jgi:hypothetical protein
VEHPEDFASGFERAFARLQIEVETACARQADWPSQVAVGIRAALDFAAAQPAAARALTTDALAAGSAGYERYDRMLTYFGERLLVGRELGPEGEQLPELVERALTGGLSMLVAQRLEKGNEGALSAAAEEAIHFVLTPYVGAEEAGRLATLHGR